MSENSTGLTALIAGTRGGAEGAKEELGKRLVDLVKHWRDRAPVSPANGRSDVEQDTLARVWERLAEYHGICDGQFIGWVRRIHNNIGIDVARRQCAVNQVPLDQADSDALACEDSPSKVVGQMEEQEHVQAALEQLSEDDRQIYRLRYDDDMAYEDIGKLLGVETANARVRAMRFRKRLAQFLPEEYRGGKS